MIINDADKSKKLLTSIGDIDDSYLDEAEISDVASRIAKRKRAVKYSTIGVAAASVCIATVILILRPKRARAIASVIESVPEFA